MCTEPWQMHGARPSLRILATAEAISCIYDVAPVKISESPASSTAIVEHLYSFPHAVPNSICGQESVYWCTLQSLVSRLLRWANPKD